MAEREQQSIGELTNRLVRDESGNITLKIGVSSIPNAVAGYAVGCLITHGTTGKVYMNTGTAASCSFDEVGAIVSADIAANAITPIKMGLRTVVALADQAATPTIAQLMTSSLFTMTPTAARTFTTPTAAIMVAGITGATVGTWFDFLIVNLGNFPITLTAGDAGVTLVGNAVINKGSALFRVRLDNVTAAAEALTIYRATGAVVAENIPLTNGSVLVGDVNGLASIATPDGAGLVAKTGAQTVAGAKTFSDVIKTGAGNGAAGGGTVTAVEYGDGAIHKTVLTCTATPFTFGDEAGQGQYGGVKVYDFPDGLIHVLGGTITGDMTLTAPAIDTWAGHIGLGVEAPTDHQDVANKTGSVVPKVAVPAAVAKVAATDAGSVATALTESGTRLLDGTTTPQDLFLNLLITDDVAHDNTITGLFTGTITFAWINLGDYA